MIVEPTKLLASPADEAETVLALKPGDPFAMLDNSLGWAWGYGGRERRVGYVRGEDIGAP